MYLDLYRINTNGFTKKVYEIYESTEKRERCYKSINVGSPFFAICQLSPNKSNKKLYILSYTKHL